MSIFKDIFRDDKTFLSYSFPQTLARDKWWLHKNEYDLFIGVLSRKETTKFHFIDFDILNSVDIGYNTLSEDQKI